MSSKRLVRADVRYLLFSEVYNRLDEPKAKRRAFGLIEAAIVCLSRSGFENVTLEMVAREAGVARSLMNHYFKDAEQVREVSIKYIRLLLQKIAVDAFAKEKDPAAILSAYIDACFYWTKTFPRHAQVWLAFLHRCANFKSFRELNSQAVLVGEERIMSLLDHGKRLGVFAFDDSRDQAKLIQTLVCGALISSETENMSDLKAYVALIRSQCLTIAGAKPLAK
ncbi:MAG: TetR family transcriptional regulator [Bdellovibrionales bacterium]